MRPKCTIKKCGKPHRARGYCQMHYKRLLRNGDPMVVQREWGHGNLAKVVGYTPAHQRVRKLRGRAAEHLCAHCGAPANDWAYNYEDPSPLVEDVQIRDTIVPMVYSLNPDCYIPLCHSCHRNFDRVMSPHRPRRLRKACKRGHEFTEANTYRPPGRPHARNCRKCRTIHSERRRAA